MFIICYLLHAILSKVKIFKRKTVFEKKYLAYIIVATVMVLNFLINDTMMIPLVIVTVVFALSILISTYREHRWVQQVLKLF